MQILKQLLLITAALLALVRCAAHGQTIEDGIMMGRRQLCAGYMYMHDSWDEYWEGELKRMNGNIGRVTTQSHNIYAIYGATDRLNVIANIPHVSTEASQGVLAGMSGYQDGTVAAKYKFFETPFTSVGRIRAIAVVQTATPVTDYTPDFLPLSIGLGSHRLGARMTVHFRARQGWFINGSSSYTWRGDVTLDRPFFYTDGRLTFSDKVPMPDVFDYALSSGYIKGELVLSGSFGEQRTQGGGDIRRQDMPFVSNRMDFHRVGAWAKLPLPKHDALSFVAGYSYILTGRNVGQASTITAGVMYLFRLPGSHGKQ